MVAAPFLKAKPAQGCACHALKKASYYLMQHMNTSAQVHVGSSKHKHTLFQALSAWLLAQRGVERLDNQAMYTEAYTSAHM